MTRTGISYTFDGRHMLSRKTILGLCLVAFAVVCLLLVSGCNDSTSADTEDGEDEAQEIESVEEGTESSASYATLTISTYEVDTSGNQELTGMKSYDAAGNLLVGYEKGSDADLGDYESTSSYAYNSDGLVSEITNEYNCDLYEYRETSDFEYQYDADGNLSEIHWADAETGTYPDEGVTFSGTDNYVAVLAYNTEGNVSSVGIYFVSYWSYDHYEDDDEDYEYEEATGYTSDSFYGVIVDFTYYFDQITEISISVGSSDNGAVTLDPDETVYSKLLEYDDDGQITSIESSPKGWPTYLNDGTTDASTFYPGLTRLFYRVLEYVDRLQGSQLSDDYVAYQLWYGSCRILEMDYDAQGDIATRKFYEQTGSLETKLSYEYEYDDYGRISTAYRTDYDDDNDVTATYISYYEYE